MTNQQISNEGIKPELVQSIPVPVKNKKIKIKKIVIMILILLISYNFFTKILPILLLDFPVSEKCMESDILTYDQNNSDSIKYVQCIRGYSETKLSGNGYDLHTQTTSGYVVSNKEGNDIKNILLKTYGTGDFYNPVDVYFIDKGLFVLKNNKKIYSLYSFKNGSLEKLRDVSFYVNNIIAYDNNELYYNSDKEKDNTLIYRENLLTGESSQVANLDYLKRDKLYNLLYFVKTFKKNNYMMMTFAIVDTDGINDDDYSLNLDTDKLIKTKTELRIYANNESYYGVPPMATLSVANGKTAASYGLDYNFNENMDLETSIMLSLKKNFIR